MVFWRQSKISFRDLFTMREVEATVLEGILPTLFKTRHIDDRILDDGLPPGTRARTPSCPNVAHMQDISTDRIANSVNGLHDTIAQLKSQFMALRLELNNLNNQSSNIDGDVIRHLLTELKAKDEENVRLKLENESFIIKNRVIEERQLGPTPTPYSPFLLEARTPLHLRNPGISKEDGTKGIAWPSSLSSRNATRYQAAGCFDVAGCEDLLEQAQTPPAKGPLSSRDVHVGNMAFRRTASLPATSQFRTEHTMNGGKNLGSQPQRYTTATTLGYEERATKRPRLTGPESGSMSEPQHQSANLRGGQRQSSPTIGGWRRSGRVRTRGVSMGRTEHPAPESATPMTAIPASEALQSLDINIDELPPQPQQPEQDQLPREVEVQMPMVTIPLIDSDSTTNKISTISRTRSRRGRPQGPRRPSSSSLSTATTAAATQSASDTRSAQQDSTRNGYDANPGLETTTTAVQRTSYSSQNMASDTNEPRNASEQTNSASDENAATQKPGGDEQSLTQEQSLQRLSSAGIAEKGGNDVDTGASVRSKRRSLMKARENLVKATMEREEAMTLAESD